MLSHNHYLLLPVCLAVLVASSGCSSTNPQVTSDMAVSSAAVDNAAGAGGGQYAPMEMQAAREKMARAHKAMEERDFVLAGGLANQAQADAKLAQSKAGSAKAQLAADALQEDIRVLHEELRRANR